MKDTLRLGQVGYGRLGKHYAHNLHFKVPGAELSALCSHSEDELKMASSELGVEALYTDYAKMLNDEILDAVLIISSTSEHPDHIIQALQNGLHVFSEKPLAFTVDECLRVEKYAQKYPGQVVMLGFNRRFDESYRIAKQKIKSGLIGKPVMVRSQTMDMAEVAEFQLQFAKSSGGIFIDYCVHDIDLARWYLESEVQSVWSLGGAFKFPEFGEYGDADIVVSTCRLKNETIAVLTAGRLAAHGHDTYTEITGTEGSIRIGRPATHHMIEIYDRHGIRREALKGFYERFEEAFLSMLLDFIRCIRTGERTQLSLDNATKATAVAQAMTESYHTGQVISMDDY